MKSVPSVTTEQMRELDRLMVEEYGIVHYCGADAEGGLTDRRTFSVHPQRRGRGRDGESQHVLRGQSERA